jgi:hypothetical protein
VQVDRRSFRWADDALAEEVINADVHGLIGFRLHRQIHPVQVAESWLDQVHVRPRTDLLAPGPGSLLPSGVVEAIQVNVWGNGVGDDAPLAARVIWAIDNRAQLAEMGARGRERAIEYYAAERNYPQLLDTLAEVVQKPVRTG